MFIYSFVCLILWIVKIEATQFNTNSTDLSKCRVHYSRSGSQYNEFYALNETAAENDTLQLDLHFSVLAASNAHILLAPSAKVQKGDPAYEIVIGAGGNVFSDIRRREKADVKASVVVKGLLSAVDPRSFWLHVSKDGKIAVGKEGDPTPFISWIDPDPLPLKVISFSTWSGVEAKWYFDCDWQDGTTEIEIILTDNERLRRDLLFHYNPYVRPVRNASTITTVSMALQISHISLDEKQASIDVIGVTRMSWHDEKLRWDPNHYGGMENMHIFRREIWQPDLVLYNAIGNARDILGDSYMVAHFTGVVEWNPSVNFKSWCDARDLGLWPKGKHRCNLILGFMQDFTHIRLKFSKNESSLIYQDSSEWSILEADVFSGLSPKNDTSEPGIFEILFTLRRNSNIYEMMYFTPFVIIAVSLLSSFWMDPFAQTKISVTCCQLVLATIMLLILAVVIPSHSSRVPFLVSLYSFTLVALVIALVMAIIVVNITRIKHSSPVSHLIATIIMSKVISVVLILPKLNLHDEYAKIDNTSREQAQRMWSHLALAIDRLLFWIYLILIAFAIYSNN